MQRETLEALLAGQYICPVAFAAAYEDLSNPLVLEEVERWLEPLGKRVARVHDAGAFFMAPAIIGHDEVRQVREDLRAYRDVYGPAIMALDLVRQASPDALSLECGDRIQAGLIETAIANNPALESQLNSLAPVIRRFTLRNSLRDRLDTLLEHLMSDGFLIRVERDKAVYQVTGRIEQLWQVLEFIEQHQPVQQQAAIGAVAEAELLALDSGINLSDGGSNEPEEGVAS